MIWDLARRIPELPLEAIVWGGMLALVAAACIVSLLDQRAEKRVRGFDVTLRHDDDDRSR